METLQVVIIFMSAMNISLGLILIVYLKSKGNTFPYSNISSLWIITFLITLLIQQVLSIFIFYLDNYNILSKKWNDHLKLINSLYIHYLFLWPILARAYYVSKSIKFNYNFLKNIYPDYNKFEKELDVQNKLFTEKKNIHISTRLFFSLFGSFFIFWILALLGIYYSQWISCALFCFTSTMDNFRAECENIEMTNFTFNFLNILKFVIDAVVAAFFFTFLFTVYSLKIKRDFLKIKIEMTLLVLFWYFFDGFFHLIKLYFENFTEDNSEIIYIIDSLMNLSFIILYCVLELYRRKLKEHEFFNILNNFDLFINYPIFFCYFKNYLKKNLEEEYLILEFYIKSMEFKNNFLNTDDDSNIKKARNLHEEYFLNDRNNNSETRDIRLMSVSLTSMKLSKFINFPTDIVERVEDIVNNGYKIEYIEHMYDDAFNYTYYRLYESYLNLIKIETENEQLIKLIGCIDFDMSDVIMKSDKEKKTESTSVFQFAGHN